MSNAGLSRRRVGAGGGTGLTIDDDAAGQSTPTGSSLTSPTRTATSSPVNGTGGTASYGGTALEGGNKVAFDPRDFVEQEQDGGKQPLLTLLDEVLLLGLKDKQVRS